MPTPGGEDLSGGYFDAGDFMKFSFPKAWAMTVLAWGGIQYREAYEAAGELDNLKDALRWSCDYFIASHPEKFKVKNLSNCFYLSKSCYETAFGCKVIWVYFGLIKNFNVLTTSRSIYFSW